MVVASDSVGAGEAAMPRGKYASTSSCSTSGGPQPSTSIWGGGIFRSSAESTGCTLWPTGDGRGVLGPDPVGELAAEPQGKSPGLASLSFSLTTGGVKGSVDEPAESSDVAEVAEEGSLDWESRGPADWSADDPAEPELSSDALRAVLTTETAAEERRRAISRIVATNSSSSDSEPDHPLSAVRHDPVRSERVLERFDTRRGGSGRRSTGRSKLEDDEMIRFLTAKRASGVTMSRSLSSPSSSERVNRSLDCFPALRMESRGGLLLRSPEGVSRMSDAGE